MQNNILTEITFKNLLVWKFLKLDYKNLFDEW